MTDLYFLQVSIALAILLVTTLLCLRFIPGAPIQRYFRKKHRAAERAFWEDVLRQILQMEQDGRVVSTEALAGSMGRSVPVLRRVLGRMGEHDLIAEDSQKVRLTEDGKRWALHILRAHRLWESYLAKNFELPRDHLHEPAERMEHFLDADLQEQLASELAGQTLDPHGRPIPPLDAESARN